MKNKDRAMQYNLRPTNHAYGNAAYAILTGFTILFLAAITIGYAIAQTQSLPR